MTSKPLSPSGSSAAPASFVVTAEDLASFADAVRRKLLLEIAGLAPAAGGPLEVRLRLP